MKKVIFSILFFISSLFSADILDKNYNDVKTLVQEVCPIKSVSIENHKDWIGIVEGKDGNLVALSSPKYTFAYELLQKKREGEDSVKNIYVTDFKTKKLIDAKTAFYVFGSNIMSIGGDDVIPFALESDAKEFFDKNHGRQIYKYDRMNENFINYLDMR